ncbi:unnamed protein product [Rotaria sp. Silwood1]|nr:unnamed protein product [Rotaria sp. Silwood1]CAF1501657.1 unnamed protein product [Rotaria sp. Silwood1]CAF3693625.1 unnamed protein product [Rotaria sp. Silwood1]CAF4547199.1 unnamed protein product [Rotaria sp. Silwood1]
MEPTLCFRLCDTPIIYLQGTICRCSGGGLMDYRRQSNDLCQIPCTKPVDRSVKTPNTCGGSSTYSAYVQDKFFIKHGHLFDYQINFASCELWTGSDVYDTSEVRLNDIGRSSLNKLEQCAATCLDRNATTRSIGFNDDSDKCLCIMPLKSSKIFDRTHYIKQLANSSCDHYCKNSYEGSKIDLKFQCGSLTNPQIWAIYELNGTCPINFIYMKELKKCIYAYKNFWNSCTPPSISFSFDESITWNNLLKIINKLNLNNSAVTIDFDDSVVIDRSWKCLSALTTTTTTTSSSYVWSSYLSRSRSSLYGWNSNTRYILEDGCLLETSYSSYSHRYSYRLCVTDPVYRYSLTDNEDNNETYIAAVNPQIKYCPTNWFDLNGRCYRVSDERKTIEQARNSCISVSTTGSTTVGQPRIWLMDSSGNLIVGNELNDSPKGDIVEYISEWQARLGFFLLDTDPDHDDGVVDTTTSLHNTFYDDALSSTDIDETVNLNHGSINEFQLIDSNENRNISNNTCLVITRSTTEEDEKPMIKNTLMDDCSKPRHVLCETNTLIVQKYQYDCFNKPNVLDLPALISNHLTHELCLSVCQELQTKLAILHINKCYCLHGSNSNSLNITTDFEKFRQKKCGNVCPGNSHELCGNDNTIVVFQIFDSRRTYSFVRTPAEPFPNHAYDSCIYLNSFNQSITYQFTIYNKHEFHPRYCLAFCTQYKQKFALINDKECLCTNKPMKDADDVNILSGQDCSQPCAGNYFYSCGNKNNVTIYSMYLLLPKCRHGFEVAENDQQCVFSHFSSKTNSFLLAKKYCESIGSTLAKINDIVEIQDILPDSILHTRLMQQLLLFYRFRFVNDTRYYWFDRTTDTADPATISERLLKQCSKIPEISDKNCIAIQNVPNSDQNIVSHERCITESNECSTVLAMPVCVDKQIEIIPTIVPPISDENPSQVSVNITSENLCDDEDNEYHFIDNYCYKILYHEVTWKDAQAECRRDKAMVFVPEKSITLQYIKSLFLRRKTYTSSGVAHVGVYYHNINRTVVQYDISSEIDTLVVPDSNAIYDLCEKTFQERYTALMISSSLTTSEKARLKTQQNGCAYIDLMSSVAPAIRCDEIPCNRTATVICQKLPTIKTSIINAKREYIDEPSTDAVTDLSSTATVISTETVSSVNANEDEPDSSDETRSIGRDFAPIFLILTIIFILILLGLISTIYNQRDLIFRRTHRHNTDSIYSQLTSANEFDLN